MIVLENEKLKIIEKMNKSYKKFLQEEGAKQQVALRIAKIKELSNEAQDSIKTETYDLFFRKIKGLIDSDFKNDHPEIGFDSLYVLGATSGFPSWVTLQEDTKTLMSVATWLEEKISDRRNN